MRARCVSLGIDQHGNEIGVFGAFPRIADHRLIEPALLGSEDAGRVDEHKLRVLFALCCVTIEILVPTRRLTSVDLPALGAPMMATKPARGHSVPAESGALRIGRRPCLKAYKHCGSGRLLCCSLGRAFTFRLTFTRDGHSDGELRLMIPAPRA